MFFEKKSTEKKHTANCKLMCSSIKQKNKISLCNKRKNKRTTKKNIIYNNRGKNAAFNLSEHRLLVSPLCLAIEHLISLHLFSLYPLSYVSFDLKLSWCNSTDSSFQSCVQWHAHTECFVFVSKKFRKNKNNNKKILRTNIRTPNVVAMTEWREFCELM